MTAPGRIKGERTADQLARYAELQRQRRRDRRARGICRDCDARVTDGQTYCHTHRLRANRSRLQYEQRRREKRPPKAPKPAKVWRARPRTPRIEDRMMALIDVILRRTA